MDSAGENVGLSVLNRIHVFVVIVEVNKLCE